MKIFTRINEVQSQTVGATLGWPQITKRHYSHKNVDGVMVLNLCTKGWSGGAMVLGKLPEPGRPTYLE